MLTEHPFDNLDILRELFFSVLESLPDGIVLADQEGMIVAMNRNAQRFLELEGRAHIHQSCWDVLEKVLGMGGQEIRTLRGNGATVTCERELAVGQDRRQHLTITHHALCSPFRSISGFFLIITDSTYLRRMEAQVERQRRLAAMGEMAVTIAQDMRNPLGSLELYVSMLRRDMEDDPDNARVAEQMMRAIRTMDHHLHNYVTFSNLPIPRPEQVNIAAWLDDTAEQLQLMESGRNICTRKQYGHTLPTIVADRELLYQLSLNLVLNAVQSMAEGGELVLSTRTIARRGHGAEILDVRVRDTGEGIAQDNLEKIFDPFYTTRKRGKGLGLAIVHRIVEAHHGLIEVESKPGAGTTVIVSLPYDGQGLRDL